MKNHWGERLTTVFPRQGHYALDPRNIAAYPPADITLECIGDLINCDLPALNDLCHPRGIGDAVIAEAHQRSALTSKT